MSKDEELVGEAVNKGLAELREKAAEWSDVVDRNAGLTIEGHRPFWADLLIADMLAFHLGGWALAAEKSDAQGAEKEQTAEQDDSLKSASQWRRNMNSLYGPALIEAHKRWLVGSETFKAIGRIAKSDAQDAGEKVAGAPLLMSYPHPNDPIRAMVFDDEGPGWKQVHVDPVTLIIAPMPGRYMVNGELRELKEREAVQVKPALSFPAAAEHEAAHPGCADIPMREPAAVSIADQIEDYARRIDEADEDSLYICAPVIAARLRDTAASIREQNAEPGMEAMLDEMEGMGWRLTAAEFAEVFGYIVKFTNFRTQDVVNANAETLTAAVAECLKKAKEMGK